jgi:hypothetical protein
MPKLISRRKVVDAREFGDLVLKELRSIARKSHRGLRRGTVQVALPFRVTFKDGAVCVCYVACHTTSDGGTACSVTCSGDC